jgi:NAD(P)H-flavin reductase
MMPSKYRVQSVIRENKDTVTLGLTADHPDAYCQYLPGQFSMVYLFGTGEIPISVSGATDNTDMLWHTIRGVGPVSRKCLALQNGDTVGIRGGFGVGWPLDSAQGKDVILVAGGIGLAPLRPVIYAILANRTDYGQVTVIYGARSPADQIFLAELEKWHATKDLTLLSTVDHATGSWSGHVGVVTEMMPQLQCTPTNTLAFLCGPEIMMHFSVLALEKIGLSQNNIYVSMERNMKCALGHCGHCQWGGDFMCKDGPVFPFAAIAKRFRVRAL